MFKKLTLAAAAGAGYVLGAKAGTQRYEQIVAKAREIAGMPAVQNATASVKETAAPIVDNAKSKASEKVSSTTGKLSGGGDDAYPSGSSGTGANTGATAPAAGAAPSATARP